MQTVLMDQVVNTDYGQFDVMWVLGGGFDGNFDRNFAGQVNGLVGAAAPDCVYLKLARRSGGSSVRIVLLDSAPGIDDLQWEDVVEVSMVVPAGQGMWWFGWAGQTGGTLEGVQPGSYRLRVSAKGRDAGLEGEFSDQLLDFYLLELWPATWQPDAILRVGSEDAKYWHREVGGRR